MSLRKQFNAELEKEGEFMKSLPLTRTTLAITFQRAWLLQLLRCWSVLSSNPVLVYGSHFLLRINLVFLDRSCFFI